MSFIAAAIIGGAAISAIGANSAADTQAAGQQQAAATQKGMFDTINAQEQPFIKAGYGATSNLTDLMGLTGTPGATGSTGLPNGYLTSMFNPTQEQLNNYPGYQFALKTGGQAVRNADTPGVGALSGAALKDLMSFNVGTANSYYGKYFDQYQTQQNNIFNRLSSIAGLGQSAASQVGNSGTQLGTGIAQAQAGAAASQAGGIVGATNALAGGANNLAGLMYLNGGGSSISPSTMAGANNSSDPIGFLNSSQGWTTPGGS